MSSVLGPGKTAVITGASSGIGRGAALDFAARGMNVWMVDIDAEELASAKLMVEKKCKDASTQTIEARVVDVSSEESMKELATEVFAKHGACHFLFNNAGVQLNVPEGGILADNATMTKTLDVNLYGPIHGCLAFVPRMKESGEECIVVNTGSKQGITMPPGNLPYNVSKAALKCYTEGLQHDLRNSPAKVRAALLVPGWVNTSIMLKEVRRNTPENFDLDSVFFHEAKPAKGAWMPQQVIDFMVQELDAGKFYLICPDNDVDRETDNLRMTWTMQDITMDRPPLSRWHPDYKDKFGEFLKENKK
mmetsp:Transcript_14083/g.35390  ORF Transcript_14083/g.35390 Transcript_14083/m.35390 type:complete len:305 (-) Transcript_14083:107-1021(-)